MLLCCYSRSNIKKNTKNIYISETSLEYFVNEYDIKHTIEDLNLVGYGTFIDDYTYLDKLPNLKILILSASIIDNTIYLKNLVQLTSLTLNLCFNITDFNYISKLSNLNYLDLSDNQLSELSFVNNLKNLKELILVRTPITNIQPIANIHNLEILNLQSCLNIMNYKHLATLTKLKTLNVKQSNLFKLADLYKLSHCNIII
jgi:internalin A